MKIRNTDIIIPVYKPKESFPLLLLALKKQSVPPKRIIIINTLPEDKDNSSEVASAIAAVYPGLSGVTLKHIKKQDFDHAGTRRMAVSLSRADSFICMTDDAVPANDTLIENLTRALNMGDDIAIAYARQIPRPGATLTEVFTRNFNYPATGRVKSIEDINELGIKTFFASNVCCAYKRHIYDELGGFIENSVFNEDMIYAATALKNGYKSCYRADALVYHSHNSSVPDEFCRNFDNGMSQALHPEIFAGITSESEGIKLVKGTCAYLISRKHEIEIPWLIFKSGAKYLGFRLGKSYKKLPRRLVLRLALNKTFAKNHLYGEDI